MNSADFFLLYLHLANHKIINNSASYPQEFNDLNISPKYSEKQKGANTSFLEQGSTKKAFCLLAFAGLRKTIAVTEWRNPFGHTGFYNQVISNNNLAQIMGKIKTLTGLKNSITSNLSYPCTAALSEGQSKTAPLVASPSSRSGKGYKKPVLDLKLSIFGQKAKSAGEKFKLREAKFITSNQLRDKLNAQILSQSFKKNYIAHLKNCGNKSFLGVNLGLNPASGEKSTEYTDGRKDHGMTLVSWASMSYFSGQPVNTNNMGQGTFSGSLIANTLLNSKGRCVDLLLEQQLRIPSLQPMAQTLPTTRSGLNFSLTVKSKESRQEAEDQEKLPSPDRVKTRARQNISQRQSFVENALSTFTQSLLATNHSLDYPGFINTEKNSIKFFFENAKQNSLLADSGLIRFYTASWLLESIRAELLLRNSNIKRVLNQVFLLAQQPLSNPDKRLPLSAPGPQSKNFYESSALGLPTSIPTPTMSKNAKATTASLDLPPSSFVESIQPGAQVLKTALSKATVIPFLIKGLRVTLSGRMGGRKGMAKTLTKTAGRVPSSTLREKVDFAKGVVQTKTGSLGIKVWICYN